jgi:hypothetical protein
MKKTTPFHWLLMIVFGCITLGFYACEKVADLTPQPKPSDTFKLYTIQQGENFCDQNTLRILSITGLRFDVIFDSTAIYQTVLPENQLDINKLYGFSEGLDHQTNSARIGWRWSNQALRLFGYTYVNGQRIEREIKPVTIGDTLSCSIRVDSSRYWFRVDMDSIQMARGPVSDTADGYQLFPYFGGDEPAPQLIRIRIREK